MVDCSAGHESYFLELVNSTQSGTCNDGSDKWVALTYQGTPNEFSSISYNNIKYLFNFDLNVLFYYFCKVVFFDFLLHLLHHC